MKSALWRARWRICGAAVGVAVVVALVFALGPSRIAARLADVGAGFGWVLAAYFAALVLYALPLGLILPRRPPVRSLVASRFAAVSVNAATPLFGLGGEPVRLLWLPPAERRPAVAALAIDRGAFLGASALFLLLGALVAVARLELPRAVRWALPSLAALGLVAAAALYLLQRRGVLAPIARLIARVAPRRGGWLATRATEIDGIIQRMHRDRPGRFTAAIAVHLAGRFASIAEVAVAARLLHLGLGVEGALVFAAVPLAVDLAFSVVPSQIGLHEGSTAILAAAFGLDPAAGVALAFLQRLRQVVFVSIGFTLLATRRRAQPSEVNSNPIAR